MSSTMMVGLVSFKNKQHYRLWNKEKIAVGLGGSDEPGQKIPQMDYAGNF